MKEWASHVMADATVRGVFGRTWFPTLLAVAIVIVLVVLAEQSYGSERRQFQTSAFVFIACVLLMVFANILAVLLASLKSLNLGYERLGYIVCLVGFIVGAYIGGGRISSSFGAYGDFNDKIGALAQTFSSASVQLIVFGFAYVVIVKAIEWVRAGFHTSG